MRSREERIRVRRALLARARRRQHGAEGRMPNFGAIMQEAKQERDGRFDGLIADVAEGTL